MEVIKDKRLEYDSIKLQRNSKGQILVGCQQKNSFIPCFMIATVICAVLSLCYLKIDWLKLLSRTPEIGDVFLELGCLNFDRMDMIFTAMLETISIAVLSLLYSLLLGVFFGMLAARNIFRITWLSVLTQAFFTFLRAVPTPVWVLLMLCVSGWGKRQVLLVCAFIPRHFLPNPLPRALRAFRMRHWRHWK
ncbi:MAG: hypothetical protein ACLTKI_02185 [Lachnospiraceae bacterium]